jgi:zinc protease
VQGQARQLGYFLTLFDDPDFDRRYLDGLATATRQDLQRVAQQYFSPEAMSVVLLGATADTDLPTKEEVESLCQRLDVNPEPIAVPAAQANRDGHVSVTMLKNGVRLIVKEHHEVPVVAIQSVMLGGLLFEDRTNSGINNFLAGMLTRGSNRFSRLELAEAVESLAGSVRGFSGRNSIGLSGSFLSTAQIDNAFDIFLETLLHPTFPTEEVEKRRRELLLLLKNREDDLAQIAFDLFYQTIFTTHPYRFPVLGNEETLRAFQREQLIDYYRALLNPAQLVVSVVGDVNTEQIVEHLRSALEVLPTMHKAAALPPHEPRSTTTRKANKTVEKQQAHLVLGFQGVALANPDRYPLKVLEAILSRQGGRLFYELREQRALAYSVTAFGVEGLAPGVVGIYVGTDPGKVDEATTAARAELKRVREELVNAEELDQAKKYLTGSYEISLQSNSAQCEEMGFNELYGLGYDNGRRYLASINAVTAEDLRRVARTYFDDEAHTLVVVGR